MQAHERETLKEQLGSMISGMGSGIDLDGEDCWAMEGLKDPLAFFRHLEALIPMESVLYFEGSAIIPEASQFYQMNQAAQVVCVVRDTVFPIPKTFPVSMTGKTLEGLCHLLSRHPREKCFDHVKAYREGKLLFAFHDAFDGADFLVSGQVLEKCVSEFASILRAKHRREPNVKKRDPRQLQRLLRALEAGVKRRG